MAGKWVEVRLGDVSDVITKGTTPTTLGYRFTDSGINFVKSESVTFDGWIDRSKFAFIDTKTHEALKRSQLREGDILFSMAGVFIGKTAVVPKQILPANTNQAVGIVRLDQRRALPRFIDYYLRNPSYNRFLNNLLAQSAQPNLNLTEIGNLPIKLPPLHEQRAIAHILGTLDNKIELNRRMNETLRAIARAIFKSWFVDFDPVRAKAESRDTGLPKLVADIFPDHLETSELGDVPAGWRVGTFGNFIVQRTERVRDCEAVVLSAVASGKLARSDEHFTKRVYSKELTKYLLIEQWDVAYNPSRINIGSVGMLEEPIVGAVSPVYVVARPEPEYRWFLEFSLRRAQTQEWINTLASGSVRQSLSFDAFASIPCVIPPRRIAAQFAKLWTILREGIQSRARENSILAGLRDTLLPRLISGEVLIPHVDTKIERVI